MVADPRDGLVAAGPTGFDIRGMVMQRTDERRRITSVVNRFGDLPGAPEGLIFERRSFVQFVPGEGAHVALAEWVPVLLMHHAADCVGVTARGHAVHGDLGHRVLTGLGFTTRLEVHVERQTSQVLHVVLSGESRVHEITERGHDQADHEDENQRALVRCVPVKAQVLPRTRQQRGTATSPGKTFLAHVSGSLRAGRMSCPAPSPKARIPWSTPPEQRGPVERTPGSVARLAYETTESARWEHKEIGAIF